MPSPVPAPYEQQLAERTARHVHKLSPIDDYTRRDGIRQKHSRCICGLEEKREYEEESCIKITYRFGGIWLEPLDILRLTLPVAVCPTCEGHPDGIACPTCGGLLVVDAETLKRVPGPPKTVRSRPRA